MASDGGAEEFVIEFDGSAALRVSEIWPDGDAPETPTVHDVKKLMEESGHKSRVLHDWCLDGAIKVVVASGAESVEVWKRG